MRPAGDEGDIRTGFGQGRAKTTADTTCSHHCNAHHQSPAFKDILSLCVQPVMLTATF
jgi:hypothetical protein